jgi:Flp pilus assembly protein TadG
MRQAISLARQKRSRGSVVVEAGLTFVILVFLLMGVFDFAQFLFIHQALADRARSAARWGAFNNPTDTTSIQNMVMYNQTTAPTGATSGSFGLTSSMVSVTTPDSGTDNYRLLVTISNYPYQVLSPTIAGTYTGPNITVSVPLGQN